MPKCQLVKRLVWIVLVTCALVVAACSGKDTAPSMARRDSPSTVSAKNDPVSRVDWIAMRDFWDHSMQLKGIDTGPEDSFKHLLVFFDPNCPVCAHEWTILKPYMKRVRIHWVPIAYLNQSSRRLAAAILAAPDPVAALAENEENYDVEHQHGGLNVQAITPGWATRIVENNTQSAVRRRYVTGTPTMGFELYKGKRYFRTIGLVDADSMRVAVAELGHTMDPWHHPAMTSEKASR